MGVPCFCVACTHSLKFKSIDLVGGGGQRTATMWTHGRDLEAERFHLRLGFCRGSGGGSHTWEADNIAGCWTTAECRKEEKVIF